MGRYAFFSTGLEFKFRFGVQESEDIRTFGGVFRYDLSGEDLCHEWDQRDRETILQELQNLQDFCDFPTIDFETYKKNLEGTHQVREDIYKLYEKRDCNEEYIARYDLGCVIYHQLSYAETLLAHYET
jgi:hypothetical protein